VGHITEEFHSVNQSLNRFFFPAGLISVTPELQLDDWVISKRIVEVAIKSLPESGTFLNWRTNDSTDRAENTSSDRLGVARGTSKTPTALIIRTRPNNRKKFSRQYYGTNPPYLLEEAMLFLVEIGVEHLLVDLPSVDKENDGGELLAHKAFWDFDGPTRKQSTITELIYVPDGIEDGHYYLNLQVAAFENDASPSRPVLYKIQDGKK
ncbi:MAG: cyclase family protein, partial [Pricia sp.]